MSNKTKRFAKGLGASALAAATIASGLSFGSVAASAAPIPASDTRAGDSAPFQLIWKKPDGKYLYLSKKPSNFEIFNETSSLAEAESKARPVVLREDGSILFYGSDGICLEPRRSATLNRLLFGYGTCSGWYTWEVRGNKIVARTGELAGQAPVRVVDVYNSIDGRLTRWGVPGTPLPVVTPLPGQAENGGVAAQSGTRTELDRTKAVEVRVGTKATADYTSAKQTVTITAPAGTSFAAGQTSVVGAWSKPGSDFSRVTALSLTDVTIDGRTMTGTFDSSKSSGFGQDKDYQLAWYPKLTVDNGATAGDRTVNFTVKGSTNLGDTNVSGSTQAVVPQVANGGVVAQAGPSATLSRTQATEVRVGTKATGSYSSAKQTVTITAPAGTTFASGQSSVPGAWSKTGADFSRVSGLDLTDVTIDGRTMTGTFDSSKSSGFSQDKDYQLAWYPTLSVDNGATAGDRTVAFTVKGSTNLGDTNVSGSTQAVVPQVKDGGLVGLTGPSTNLDRSKPTVVPIEVRADDKITSINADISFTAPAGTSFDANLTELPLQYFKDGRWQNSRQKLVDITILDQKLTGRLETTSGFDLEDQKFRFAPTLSVDNGATAGDRTVAFTVKGSTNLGDTNVSGSTQAVVPQVKDGGLVGLTGPSTNLDRSKPTVVPIEVRADDKITSINADISFTAPAGTSFDANLTELPLQYFKDGRWQNSQQKLVDITILDQKLTGRLETTSGFNLEDQKFRFAPTLSVDNGATAGSSSLEFALKGSTNLGTTSVESATAVAIPADATIPFEVTTPANNSTVAGPTVDFTGRAEPGTQVRIIEGATNVMTNRTADAQGDWSGTSVALTNGVHNLTVQYTEPGQGQQTQPLTITVQNGVVQDFEITEPTDGATLRPGPFDIKGLATTGTMVNVVNSRGDILMKTTTTDASGNWSGKASLPSGTHVLTAQYTEPGSGAKKTVDFTVTVEQSVVQPFEVTSPANGGTVTSNTFDITGIGTTGTIVNAIRAGNTNPIMQATTDSNGDWSGQVTLPNGTHTITVQYLEPGKPGKQTVDLTITVQGGTMQPFDVTSPADGATVNSNTFDVTGVGATGTTVNVVDKRGDIVMARTTIDADGNWSGQATLPTGTHTVTVQYTEPGKPGKQTEKLTLTVVGGITQPFELTSPSNNDTVSTNPQGTVTFTGKASTGTMVNVIRNGSTTPVMPTLTVGPSGDWTGTADLPDGPNGLTVQYIEPGTPGKQMISLAITVERATVQPFSFDSHQSGDVVTANAPTTFSGKATTGTQVNVINRSGANFMSTVTADAKGNWSGDSVNIPRGTHSLLVQYTEPGVPDKQTVAFTLTGQ